MKKNKKIIISIIAAGAIIYLITKFIKKSSSSNSNTSQNYPVVNAFEDPKFIFKQARVDAEKMMLFPNYTWMQIITFIYENPKDYDTILELFESCTRQVQAAWLSRQFKIKYDKDLYNYLKQNLTKNQVIKITDHINSLPEVFSLAKPGEYGDKGYIKPLK